jgi:hypothetical protein
MTQQRPRRLSAPAPAPSVETGSTAPPLPSCAESTDSGKPVRIPEVSCVSVFKADTQEWTLSEAQCIKTLRILGWVQIGPYELRKPRWRTRGEV